MTIGRSEKCLVQLSDPLVAARHAKIYIRRSEGELVLSVEDLGSTNGTSVKGVPIKPLERKALRLCDWITTGRTVLMVIPQGDRTPEERPPSPSGASAALPLPTELGDIAGHDVGGRRSGLRRR